MPNWPLIHYKTNKSSDGFVDYCKFKTANFDANFPQTIALFASFIPPRRANRPFIRLSPYECEFRLDFGGLVRLDGLGKSSSKNRLHRRTNRDENLFVPFSHQTICPFETICPSRRFVRLLV